MRKVKYLVAALLLMGATTTFTSCIDNDEPAGITDLRGAKAELIRAKAAVETARVAYVEAQTRWANAEAEAKEISNKMDELEYLREQAQNEYDIAKIQAELEIYKVKWEQLLYQNKINLEETKKQYNDLMASLEAAGEVLNEKEETILKAAKIDLQEAYDYQQQRYDEYEKAQKDLNDAYGDFDVDSEKKDVERKIEYKKFELQLKQNWAAYLQNMLNKDFGVADWEKEVAALDDSIKALVLQKGAITEDSAKFVASEEYRLAEKAVADTKNAYENDKLQAEFKYEIPEEIVGDFTEKVLKEVTVGSGNAIQYLVEEGNKTYFVVEKNTAVTSTDKKIVPFEDVMDDLVKQIETRIKDFNNEWDADLDDSATNGTTNLENQKKAYEEAVKAWKAALDKYNAMGSYSDADIKKAQETAEAAIKNNYANATLSGTSEEEVAKRVSARNAIAAALVTYYKAVDSKTGLTTKTRTIEITNPVGGGKTKVDKTVLEWLSDATYSGVYLDALLDYDWGTGYLYVADKTVYEIDDTDDKNTGFIKSITTPSQVLTALESASLAAFGDVKWYLDDTNYTYLRAEPSLDDVRNAIEKEEAAGATTVANSAAGKVVDAEDKVADYEDKAKYEESYEALQTAFLAEQKVITDRLAELKEAMDEADAKFEEYEATEKDYEDRIDAIEDTIDAVEKLIEDLKDLVSGSLPENSESTAAFIQAYTKKLDDAKADIIKKEKEIAEQEEILAQLENGTYTNQMKIEQCKQAVEFAKAVCAEADKLYEDALARLQAVVEALTKGDTASAE